MKAQDIIELLQYLQNTRENIGRALKIIEDKTMRRQ